MSQPQLESAYQACLQLAQQHYENFPVASRLLPKKYRRPIAVIYAFARQADDFADEGDLTTDERLQLLDGYSAQLTRIEQGLTIDEPLFLAIQDIIQQHQLPIQLFHDLLTAFKQDVTKTRYVNFGEVMDYCRYSANPVGRLLLHLYDQADERNLAYSDAICSALQLINFLQDLSQDYVENNRMYLPQDEMARFGVTEVHIKNRTTDQAMRQLVEFQIRRIMQLLQAGAPLGKRLTGRFGFEIRLTVMGGSRVLQKLNEQYADVFSRPRLSKWDYLWMFWKALRAK